MVDIGEMVVTKAFEQLGVLVLDGSGSMAADGETDKKAAEVAIVTRGLISRLKNSTKKEGFYLSVVMYDHNVEERLNPTLVVNVDETGDYNPLNNHGGETAIGDALEKAYEICDEFVAMPSDFRRSSVIILMTDGQNNRGRNPEEVADKIKSSGRRIIIHAVGYGKDTDIDKSALERIVSGSGNVVYTRDPETLRKFFEASLAKIQ